MESILFLTLDLILKSISLAAAFVKVITTIFETFSLFSNNFIYISVMVLVFPVPADALTKHKPLSSKHFIISFCLSFKLNTIFI